jgi:carbon starvation protein
LQDVLGGIWKPLGETRSIPANVLASALVVAAWGYFLIQGVRDPLGGINSLWPLFGIANQLLASIALCLATTVILKMQLGAGARNQGSATRIGRPLFALVTLLPLIWLLTVTISAGVQKIFHPEPRIGFLAQAAALDQALPALRNKLDTARATADAAAIAGAGKEMRTNRTLRFNNRLDAVVTGTFLLLVIGIVVISIAQWLLLVTRKRIAALRESDPVWLPEYAVTEGTPARLFGFLALALGLARELSGEAALERAEKSAPHCQCCGEPGVNLLAAKPVPSTPPGKKELYEQVLERRFNGVNRCC